jgi:hypothetical protein
MFRRPFFKRKVSVAPIEAADLVKVWVMLGLKQVPPLAPGAEETPPEPADRKSTSKNVRDLRKPASVRALVDFANCHLDGWFDATHTPIGTATAIFYVQNTPVAVFSSGRNFFLRGQFPASKVLLATNSELLEFDRLLHIA